MGKIKKESIAKENKKNLFYYEIIGVLLAFFSFFALAKLGSFGTYLNLTLKLLFGDWAFLLIILGILSGCYFLMVHEHLPISSLRVIGIFLVFLSLVVLSHFSMHKYISQYTSDYFSLTISLYIDYFKSANGDSLIGGGIIGMCFFYAFFYLLSTPGVIIISLMMILLGVSFISRKTMKDFIKLFVYLLKKLFNFIKKIKKKLTGALKEINSEYGKDEKKKIPKNLIYKYELNIEKENSYGEEIVKEIKVILNKLNIFLYNVSYYLTPHLVVIEIKSVLKINFKDLEINLSRTIGVPFLLKFNEDDNIIYVEILNPKLKKLTLYEVIQNYKEEVLFLTINDHNKPEYLNQDNKSVLLFCNEIINLEFYIVLGLLKKKNIYILDTSSELTLYQNYVDLYFNLDLDLNRLLVEIENIDSNIDVIMFLNLNEACFKHNDFLNKIKYLIDMCKDKSIYIVARINKFIYCNNYFYDYFSYLFTIDVDSIDVLKLFGFMNSNGLNIGYEGILKNQDIIMRVALCNLLDQERKKLE